MPGLREDAGVMQSLHQYKAEWAMCHGKGSDGEKVTTNWWRSVVRG